jgi:hypothetical protein
LASLMTDKHNIKSRNPASACSVRCSSILLRLRLLYHSICEIIPRGDRGFPTRSGS